MVLSSGDDTVNGTAAERGCIRREAAIPSGVPFLVATGNHDSDVTEAQMRSAGMTVLDGQVVEAAGLRVLGDDDPEHNIPFSVDRVKDRPESEEEMGQRLVDVARDKRTDVMLVHQPAAARVIMNAPNLPAPLVLWGHYHAQSGPRVIMHDDGSWTVGMQEGTAGGVREPTVHLLQHAVLPAADQRRCLLLLPRQGHGPDHRGAAGALPTRCERW